jgi:hypothetical protein
VYNLQVPTERALQPAGELAPADVIRFSYFHYVRRFWIVGVWLLFLFFLAGLGAVFSSGDPDNPQNRGALYLPTLVVALLMFGLPYLSARRQHAKLLYLREPMRYYFTNEGIRLEGPNFSSEIAWKLVQRVYETKRAFLIYQSSQTAWILPKRFFWGEDLAIQGCRQFIVQHLTKPKLFHGPTRLDAWF